MSRLFRNFRRRKMKTMESNEEIDRCPCCGHEARFLQLGSNDEQYGFVYCTSCGLMTAKSEREKAIARWNSRDK